LERDYWKERLLEKETIGNRELLERELLKRETIGKND
jgi:hypothetical protein